MRPAVKRQKLVRQSVLTRFIATYVVLVIITVASIGILMYSYAIRNTREEIERIQEAALAQYASLFNSDIEAKVTRVFSDLFTLSNQDKSTGIQSLLYGDEHSYVISRLHTKLRSTAEASNCYYALEVYDREKRLLISSHYGLKYLSELNDSNIYYKKWIDDTENMSAPTAVLPTYEFTHSGEIQRTICFARCFPTTTTFARAAGAAAVHMQESYFYGLLRSLAGGEDGCLLLIDDSGRALSGSERAWIGVELAERYGALRSALQSDSGAAFLGEKDDGQYVCCSAPLCYGLRLVRITPASSFYASMLRMRNTLLLACAFAALLGVAIACVFSTRMYHPLRSLAGVMRSTARSIDAVTEYDLIDKTIRELNSRISALNLRIESNQPLLLSNLAISLINGGIRDEQTLTRQLELSGITLPKPLHCRALALRLLNTVTRNLKAQNLQLLKDELLTSARAQDAPGLCVLTAEIRVSEIAVLLLGEPAQCAQAALALGEYARTNYAGMLCMALSEPAGDPLLMDGLWRDACALAEQYFFHPESPVMRAEPIAPLPAELWDDVGAFERAALAGDFGRARETAEDVFRALGKAWFDPGEGMATLKAMAECCARTCRELDGAPTEGFEELARAPGQSDSLPVFRSIFMKRLEEMDAARSLVISEQAERTLAKVKEYIREHLDEDLSLAVLSEQAALSPNYLSRQFKRVVGVGLAAYIIDARLERACELLAQPSLTVEEIASRVGYPTPHYFSKQFKAKYVLTPKQYRAKLLLGQARQ